MSSNFGFLIDNVKPLGSSVPDIKLLQLMTPEEKMAMMKKTRSSFGKKKTKRTTKKRSAKNIATKKMRTRAKSRNQKKNQNNAKKAMKMAHKLGISLKEAWKRVKRSE